MTYLNKRIAPRISRRAFLAAGAAMACASARFPGTARAQTASDLERMLKRHKVPGLCMAQVESGAPSPPVAGGLRSTEPEEPMEPETVFEAASLSKPVFACAVMRLRDRGLIDLDAPLEDYVTTPLIPDEPRMRSITARMVLSHRSGIPHGREEGEPMRLQFDPGAQFQYSATGFDYLQRVVEQLSGKDFGTFMRAEVLEPLDMTKSSFGWHESFAQTRASAYDAKGKPGITFNERYRTANEDWRRHVKSLFPELSYPSAAAGMYTTAGDYAKLMAAMMDPTENPGWLSASSIEEMLRPQISAGKGVSWGLGWGLMDTRHGPAFWHWGNWAGLYQHLAVGLAETKRAVVVLTNSGNGLDLCKDLAPGLLNVDLKPIRGFLS